MDRDIQLLMDSLVEHELRAKLCKIRNVIEQVRHEPEVRERSLLVSRIFGIIDANPRL